MAFSSYFSLEERIQLLFCVLWLTSWTSSFENSSMLSLAPKISRTLWLELWAMSFATCTGFSSAVISKMKHYNYLSVKGCVCKSVSLGRSYPFTYLTSSIACASTAGALKWEATRGVSVSQDMCWLLNCYCQLYQAKTHQPLFYHSLPPSGQ